MTQVKGKHMTQDEIIEMAKQTGYSECHMTTEPCGKSLIFLEAFAKLVADKEREACAEICDTWPLSAQNMIRMDSWKGNKSNAVAGSIYECASLIRARGQA